MLFASILSAITVVTLGFLVKEKKFYFLIAGINTMDEEDKKDVDVPSVARKMGLTCYFLGGVYVLCGLAHYFFSVPVNAVATVFILVTLTAMNLLVLAVNPRHGGNGKKIVLSLVVFDLLIALSILGMWLWD